MKSDGYLPLTTEHMNNKILTITALLFLFSFHQSSAQIDFDTIVDYDGFFDQLTMDEILVTGSFEGQKRGQSNLSISTFDYDNPKYQNKTLSELLENVPGVFIDASIGEVQNRIHSRGISIAAEDDLGWYYTALLEDGLPVTLTQHTYYSPDLFFRADASLDKVEFIRGGKSSVIGVNAPGGILNAISKDGSPTPHATWNVGYGQSGMSRDQIHINLQLDGPLNQEKKLYYNVGMKYRFDEGARNTNFNLSEGAQIKGNIKKITDKTIYRLRVKYLNDVTNRYLGLPATNWSDPQPANGFDFNTTALMLPAFATILPDGRNGSTSLFDTEKGINTTDAGVQLDVDHQLGATTLLRLKTKVSRKTSDWNTFIGNQPLGLESFLPYFLTGYENPWGQIDFAYVGTGEAAASINNLGALAAFSGMEPSFDYLNGDSLPNDALLGTALWNKNDTSNEWVTSIGLEGETQNHEWAINGFYGMSNVDMYTSASYAFATYEAEPRLLTATLIDPVNGNVALSDAVGVSNYNGLFYEDAQSKNAITNLSINDIWSLDSKWKLHLGAKIENVNYKGTRYAPDLVASTGGVDADIQTGYDNSSLQRGQAESFDDNFTVFNYAIGLNHTLSKSSSVFINYSSGKKAPELNYYFNTFSGVPIETDPEVQSINQLEIGYNYTGKLFSAAIVGFDSELDNFSSNDFAADDMTGAIFYTPFQNNKVSVYGIEAEAVVSILNNLNLSSSITLQSSTMDRFTVYNANGSVDSSDDEVVDFSDNKVAHTPSVIISLRPEFEKGKFSFYLNYRYMSSRYANAENSFELPGFGTLGGGIYFKSNRMIAGLDASNILNNEGLLNFFGPDNFGSSSNQATAEYIQNNPNGRFVVFPILPRAIRLTLGYEF